MAFLIPATAVNKTIPKFLCSIWDQALDKGLSDTAAYRKTLDPRELRPLPGDMLTKFEFTPISSDATGDIECVAFTKKQKGRMYYDACISSYYDVQIKDGETVLFGRSENHDFIPWEIKSEIGHYAKDLCSKVAADFFGLSLRTPADDTQRLPDGVETAQATTSTAPHDGQSQTETTNGGRPTST